MLEWATLVMASIGAVGSVCRVLQNIKSHRMMGESLEYARKAHRKRKKK
jgi:hypothetical protein